MLKDISIAIQKEKDKLNKEISRISKECDGGKHELDSFYYTTETGSVFLVRHCKKCTFSKSERV